MFPHHLSFGKFSGLSSIAVCTYMFLSGMFPVDGQEVKSKKLDVTEVVRRARLEVTNYQKEFRNLLAKETKTFQIYDKKSNLKKKRVIVSNFLVYDLSKGKDEITEFRNVLSVDGKPVSDIDQRAVDLFEKVAKAETSYRELERIQKESLRYDEQLRMYGLTLFQAIGLSERLGSVMSFAIKGKTTIGNAEFYIIEFEQIRESPLVSISSRGPSLPGAVVDYDFDLKGLKNVDPRLSGTLWIDANTFQLAREDRKLSIRIEIGAKPFVVAADDFVFEESRFGIRTPKRISHTEFRVDRDGPGRKEIEIVFEYSEFTRPEVEVTPGKPKSWR